VPVRRDGLARAHPVRDPNASSLARIGVGGVRARWSAAGPIELPASARRSAGDPRGPADEEQAGNVDRSSRPALASRGSGRSRRPRRSRRPPRYRPARRGWIVRHRAAATGGNRGHQHLPEEHAQHVSIRHARNPKQLSSQPHVVRSRGKISVHRAIPRQPPSETDSRAVDRLRSRASVPDGTNRAHATVHEQFSVCA
jgi:hypothetical protein